MASDFTVIIRVRQRFGDRTRDPDEDNPDSSAPFVGSFGTFQFDCPNIDTWEDAVLSFQHRGATHYVEHPVRINDQVLAGGVSSSPRLEVSHVQIPQWVTRQLIVPPGVLSEESNTLRIDSTRNPFNGNFDDFTIDNVVISYKTGSRSPGPIPTSWPDVSRVFRGRLPKASIESSNQAPAARRSWRAKPVKASTNLGWQRHIYRYCALPRARNAQAELRAQNDGYRLLATRSYRRFGGGVTERYLALA